jgi:flagellar hook-length control protein FliK
MQAIQLPEICRACVCSPQEGTSEAEPADRPSLFAFLLAFFDSQTAASSGAATVQQGGVSVSGETGSPAEPTMDQAAAAGLIESKAKGGSVPKTGGAGECPAPLRLTSQSVSGRPGGAAAHPGEDTAGRTGRLVKAGAADAVQVQTVRLNGSAGPKAIAELLTGEESDSVPQPATGTAGRGVVSLGGGTAKTQRTDGAAIEPWTWVASARDGLPNLPLRAWLSGRAVPPGEGPGSIPGERVSLVLDAAQPGQSAEAVSPSFGKETASAESTGGLDRPAPPSQAALPEDAPGTLERESQGKTEGRNAKAAAPLVAETKSGIAEGRLSPRAPGSTDGGRAGASSLDSNAARGASVSVSVGAAHAKAVPEETVTGAANATMVADALGGESRAEGAGPEEAVLVNAGPAVFQSGSAEGSGPQPVFGGVVQGVLKGVHYLLAKGRQTMRVRLKPDWLGDVRIEVSSREQSVVVRLFAHHENARKALIDHLGALQNLLTRSGVEVSQVTVSSEAPFDAASGGGQGRDAPFPNSARPAAQAHGTMHDSPMKGRGLERSNLGEGHLNLFA